MGREGPLFAANFALWLACLYQQEHIKLSVHDCSRSYLSILYQPTNNLKLYTIRCLSQAHVLPSLSEFLLVTIITFFSV